MSINVKVVMDFGSEVYNFESHPYQQDEGVPTPSSMPEVPLSKAQLHRDCNQCPVVTKSLGIK